MFSLYFQEKLRKPIIAFSGLLHQLGVAGSWLRLTSATHRFIIWRSPYIKSFGATHIIDIGANSGEFALMARAAFPQAKIISFEPQEEVYMRLKSLMRKDKNFQSYMVALGEKNETTTMHISQFSPSSSFVFKSQDSRSLQIALQKLDDYNFLIQPTDITILKMDVEGFEFSILKGADLFLLKTNWIYVECRSGETDGCKFSELYEFLISKSWEYMGAYDSTFSKDGELLYFDAFFKNTRKIKT